MVGAPPAAYHGPMTYLRSLTGLTLLVSAAVGCSSGPQVVCPCPSGGAQISLANLPAAAASASADSPCSVTNGGSWLLVNSPHSGTCKVHVQLTDGETYTSSVSFTGGGGCCPYTYFGTPSTLERTDAGSD